MAHRAPKVTISRACHLADGRAPDEREDAQEVRQCTCPTDDPPSGVTLSKHSNALARLRPRN